MSANVLQILPRAPGTFDGVGDYALALARKLRDRHSINSAFVARETEAKDAIDSFPIFPLQELPRAQAAKKTCDGVILHYVNYGFQKRGVPLTLLSFLKSLRRGGALLVIFHELFASGPPWRSEFCLRPLQKKNRARYGPPRRCAHGQLRIDAPTARAVISRRECDRAARHFHLGRANAG